MAKNVDRLLLKKSNRTTNGNPNLPEPSTLVEGELAINYAAGVETLSFKNSASRITVVSSDDYYTRKKLGSAFTEANSAKTVTEVINNEVTRAQAAEYLLASAIDQRLTISSFDAYSAATKSEFDTYSAATKDAIDVKLEKVDFDTYSAATKDAIDEKLATSDFNTYSANVKTEFDAYSAATKDAIDSKLATDDFSTYSANVKSEFDAYSADTKDEIDAKLAIDDFNAYSADVKSEFDTYSAATKDAIDAKLAIDDFNVYSASVDSNVDLLFGGVEYDSSNKLIKFYHEGTSGTVLAQIDATDFIKDGMVDNVEIKDVAGSGTCLVITFNTDSGKEEIDIKLTDIFDPSEYYTKDEINEYSAATKGAIDEKLATNDFNAYSADVKSEFDTYSAATKDEIDEKLATSDFNTYSAATKDVIDEKLAIDDFNTYSAETKELIDTKSDSGHTHASSAVTAMTSYAIAASATSITPADTLNEAIGKLEKGVEDSLSLDADGNLVVRNGLDYFEDNTNSVVFGVDNSAYGISNSIIFGDKNNVQYDTSTDGNLIIGSDNFIYAEGPTRVIGDSNRLNNSDHSNNSTVIGSNNTFTGNSVYNAYVFGYLNTVDGDINFIVGTQNKTFDHSSNAHILGDKNKIHDDYQTVLGSNNTLESGASYSVAVGNNNHLNNTEEVALGNRLTLNNASEIALGNENISTESNVSSAATHFSVGNGTDINSHNALEIKQNGDMYIVDSSSNASDSAKPMIFLQGTLETLSGASHAHSNKSYLDTVSGNVGTMAYEDKLSYSSATEVNNALATKSDTDHTHVLSAITDVTAPLVGINSITGAVGSMAFEDTDSYSSATEVNAAFAEKLATDDFNTYSAATKNVIDEKLAIADFNTYSGAVDTEMAKMFNNAKYETSGSTKVINFYHDDTIKATIDATDFIKDGFLSGVTLEDRTVSGETQPCLVFVWNVDAGIEETVVPIGDAFNPDNYYTKSEINTYSAATKNAIDEKLATDDFNTYSAATKAEIDSKSSNGHGHTSDEISAMTSYSKAASYSSIEVTDTLNEAIGKLEKNFDNYSSATEVNAALAIKSDADHTHLLSGITDVTAPLVGINSITGAVGTMAFEDADSYSSATEVNDALATKSDTAHTHVLSAITDVTASVEAINSLSGEVGSMAFEDADSYSSATEVSDALDLKLNITDFDTKIGSAFTGTNSANTITSVIVENERVTSAALNALNTNKVEVTAYTAFTSSTNSTLTAHTANTTIHVTAADKTAWNAKVDTSDIENFFDDAKYELSGTTHVINFYNGSTLKATIDAEPFIVDGMIESVSAGTSAGTTILDIKWNTAAGGQETIIEIGDIFDADNYYTTAQTSGATELTTEFAKHYLKDETSSKTEIDDALAEKSDTAHTHVLSAITDVTAPLVAINSLTTAVGTMAFEDADSYSSATEVNDALATKADGSHTHASSAVTTMTSYAKAASYSAITSADTLNEAIGKLEKGIEDGLKLDENGNLIIHNDPSYFTGNTNSLIFGEENTFNANGDNSYNFILGTYNSVEGNGDTYNNIILGSDNSTYGTQNTIIGHNNDFLTSDAVNNIYVIGRDNSLETDGKGYDTYILGNSNVVNADSVRIVGYANKIGTNGLRSSVIGDGNTANNAYQFIGGANLTSNNQYEVAIGYNNDSTESNVSSAATHFSVGNGYSSDHNALEIKQNGDMYIVDSSSNASDSAKPMIFLQGALETLSGASHSHSNKSYLDTVSGSVGTMAYEDKASYSSATEVNTALAEKLAIADFNVYSGTVDAEMVKMFNNAKYEMSGETHVINFYHDDTIKATIDATDFIVDGFLSGVTLEDREISGETQPCLVFDWNTDAGIEETVVPIGDAFNPDNYYTKDETSGKTELATAFDAKSNTGHNHTSDEVSAMTSYAKAASYSAITSGDTLNEAIGKLEKGIEDGLKLDADGNLVIHNSLDDFTGNTNSVVFGADNSAYDMSNSLIFGNENDIQNETSTDRNIVLGSENTFYGAGDTRVIGDKNNLYDVYYSTGSTVIGNENVFHGDSVYNAHVFGFKNTITDGDNTYIFGQQNKISGNEAHVVGDNNTIKYSNQYALGSNNTFETGASLSVAVGHYNQLNNTQEAALGNSLTGNNQYEVAIGYKNISTTSNVSSAATHFSVGNGINNSHNALEIKQNGDMYIVDSSSNASDDQKPMINLQGTLEVLRGASHAHSNKSYLDTVSGNVGSMAYEDKASYSSATEVNNALATKADGSHTHASSAVTSMTSYAKAASYSAITSADTLNEAIGKLEKGIEDGLKLDEKNNVFIDLDSSSTVGGSNNFVFGESNNVGTDYNYNFVYGDFLNVTGSQNIVLGYNNAVTAHTSMVFGHDIAFNNDDGDNEYEQPSVVIGRYNDVIGFDTFVFGNYNYVYDCDRDNTKDNIILGSENYVKGTGNTIIGGSNTLCAEGENGDDVERTFVIGMNNRIHNDGLGYDSYVYGNSNEVYSNMAYILGSDNKAHFDSDEGYNALRSAIVGYSNNSYNGYQFMGGSYLQCYNNNESSIGYNNISTSSDTSNSATCFSVGNGFGGRHNALEIKQNGDMYIVDTSSNASDAQKPMINLQDTLETLSAASHIDQVIDSTTSGSSGAVSTSAVCSYVNSKLGTGFTSSSVTEVIESNERVFAGALNDIHSSLGGLKFVKLTQAQYDALSPNYDEDTIYFIKD